MLHRTALLAAIILPIVTACSGVDDRAVRTDIVEAAEAYTTGTELMARRAPGDAQEALDHFQGAIELDPDFAQAWAGAAHARSWMYWIDGAEDQLDPAEEAIERAEELEPGAPQTLVARGFVQYYGYLDYDGALEAFNAALEQDPEHAEALGAVGTIHRRQGRLAQAIDFLERRQTRMPSHRLGYGSLGQTYSALGEYDEVLGVAQRLADLDEMGSHIWTFWAYFHSGDTATAFSHIPPMREATDDPSEPVGLEVLQALVRRDEAAMNDLVSAMGTDVGLGPRSNMAAHWWSTGTAAEHADAFDVWIADLDGALQTVESETGAAADRIEASAHAQLAFLEAARGNEEAARAHATQVPPLQPMVTDTWQGSDTLRRLAAAYAMLGDTDASLEILERLPAELNYSSAQLRMTPEFTAMHDNPRFQAVMEARTAIETPAEDVTP